MRPLFLLLALWPAVLSAAPPTLKLTPSAAKPAPGELVTVVAETTGKTVKWAVIGDAQSRTDTGGKSVVLVAKSGRVTVIAVASNETGELSEFAEVAFGELLKCDPIPAPRPVPVPPKPIPKPIPKPAPVGPVKIKAVVVYESETASTSGAAFFAAPTVVARWKEKGHLPPVVTDKDVKDPATNATPAKLKPYIDRAGGKSLPQLYLVDSVSGAVLYEGPTPETPEALIALLTKIGA